MEITQIAWTDIAKDAFLNTINDNFLLVEGKKWADKASASTVDLSTVDGTYVHITGTTTITAFWTLKAGIMRVVRFAWILTLTHNATSLILPTAANITTAANDTMILVSEWSGNWRVVAYQRADWTPLVWGGWWASSPHFNVNVDWVQIVSELYTYVCNWAVTAWTFRASLWVKPTGADFIIKLYKNGTEDASITIATTATTTNGLYQWTDTTFVSGSYAAWDVLTVEVTQIGSSVAWSDLTVSLFE